MTQEQLRREALARALSEHPEWVNIDDPVKVAQLNDLADRYETELRLQQDILEVRRREFAEKARQQGELARQQREKEDLDRRRQAQARLEDEARRRESARQERLVAMNPLMRWLFNHKTAVIVMAAATAAVLLIVSSQIMRSESQSSSDSGQLDSDAQSSTEGSTDAAIQSDTASVDFTIVNCMNYSNWQKTFAVKWQNSSGSAQSVLIRATTVNGDTYEWTDLIKPGESVENYGTHSADREPSDPYADGGLPCGSKNFAQFIVR
jgi:hypothetical protein